MRILRGTGSRILSCGCLIGLYETYEGRSIAMVDAPDPRCGNPAHKAHELVDLSQAPQQRTPPPADEKSTSQAKTR
jgi:hypothetical protein